MKRRILTLCMALVMLITCTATGYTAKAADASSEELQEIIIAMKTLFDIDESYTEFSYDHYNAELGNYWNLNWNTKDYSKSIRITCDSEKRVNSYSTYDKARAKNAAPAFTKDKLRKTAEKAIADIAPQLTDHVAFEHAYSSIYNAAYTYHFVRTENGIRLPENEVTVTLDYVTGDVLNFSVQWQYGLDIPSADGIITKEEAAEKVGKKLEMHLAYYVRVEEDGSRFAFLAYTPDRDYIAVDAKTGKIYTTRTYWESYDNGDFESPSSTESATVDKEAALTEAELGEIENFDKLIPSSKAIELVRSNKKLYIESSVTSWEANLSKNYDGSYVWNITGTDNRPINWETDDYYRAYVNAELDAETGKIIFFSASTKEYFDNGNTAIAKKAKYSKDECIKLFESFVKEVDPDIAAKMRFESSTRNRVIDYKESTNKYVYGGYDLTFGRYENDIPVSGEYVYGDVDGLTGKVVSFYTSWSDEIKFESSKKIISADKACKAYLSYEGFAPVYELVTNIKEKKDASGEITARATVSARLVYSTDIWPVLVAAKDGAQLEYTGERYVKPADGIEYKDIKGTKYEEQIRLLADIGVGFEGGSFKPDQIITEAEFAKLLGDLSPIVVRPYIHIVYSGSESGSANEKKYGKTKLTRQNAACIIIDSLGYSELASYDIYKTGFSDEKKIDASKRGCVALAKAFGILSAKSGKKFAPSDKITRGEAAEILLKTVGCGK